MIGAQQMMSQRQKFEERLASGTGLKQEKYD